MAGTIRRAEPGREGGHGRGMVAATLPKRRRPLVLVPSARYVGTPVDRRRPGRRGRGGGAAARGAPGVRPRAVPTAAVAVARRPSRADAERVSVADLVRAGASTRRAAPPLVVPQVGAGRSTSRTSRASRLGQLHGDLVSVMPGRVPADERVRRALRGRGLVVIAVDVQEESAVAPSPTGSARPSRSARWIAAADAGTPSRCRSISGSTPTDRP